MKDAKDFSQYVIETYGKSIYQIALEVACAEFVAGEGTGKTAQDAAQQAAKRAWDRAGIFIEAMKRNYES